MQLEDLQKEISEVKVNVGKIDTKLLSIKEDVSEIKQNVGNHITDMLKTFSDYKDSVDERFINSKNWLIGILVTLIFTLLAVLGTFLI